MPVSAESPSYSSSRVQRAYRINNIEQSRLSGKLNLLEKQKVHQMRLTNQDIRMVSVTLDYIQSSSGKSPEGMSPAHYKANSESENDSDDDEDENGPCFLYGERIVSRKARRFRRPQSAMDRSTSRRGSVSSFISDSVTSLPTRPQSSPMRRRPVLVWNRGEDCDKHSDSESERSEYPASGRSTPKYDWENDTSDITKKILRAEAQKRKDPRRSLPAAIRRHGAFNDMPSSPVPSSGPSRSGSPNLYPPRRSSSTAGPGRHARLSEILNQRRPTLTATAWRNHLSRTQTTPMSMQAAREYAREEKMKTNEAHRQRVQDRVQGFINSYPV